MILVIIQAATIRPFAQRAPTLDVRLCETCMELPELGRSGTFQDSSISAHHSEGLGSIYAQAFTCSNRACHCKEMKWLELDA